MTPDELKIQKEIEKMEKEIDLLNFELTQKKKKRKLFDTLTWIAGGVTVVISMCIAGFNLYEPLVTYLDKEAEKTQFDLNQGMIALIEKDNGSDESQAKIISALSYYEYNSMPLILYFVESREPSASMKNSCKGAVKKILIRAKDKTKVIDEINNSFSVFLEVIDNDKYFERFKTYLEILNDAIYKNNASAAQRASIVETLRAARVRLSKKNIGVDWYVNEIPETVLDGLISGN